MKFWKVLRQALIANVSVVAPIKLCFCCRYSRKCRTTKSKVEPNAATFVKGQWIFVIIVNVL